MAEDACILGAAYLGGVVYFGEMSKHHDTVFCDENSHSNLILGMHAAGLSIHTYKHLDAHDLGRQIAKYRGERPIIATDGVFGISGEIAPLPDLYEIGDSYSAELFVDDAHGVGVLGPQGRGILEYWNVPKKSMILLGSMSKAMGVNGGFLVGTKELISRFKYSPAVSGSAVPPFPQAAACLEAIRIVRKEPGLREKMQQNADSMRKALHEQGIRIVSDQTPIIAMVFQDEYQAVRASKHFEGNGIRIPYFKYISEPRQNILRAAARACHTEEQLQRFKKAVHSLIM
jgi:7-keto-8-aminopelargonate synthetase-like enzyme